MKKHPHLVLLVLVLVAAGALRLWRVGEVPPGFQFDEAHNALDARRVLAGDLQPFFTDNGGREPLVIYLEAGALALLGPDNTVVAIRLVSALVGLLTVALMYRFATDYFGRPFLGVLAAGYLALSYWHLHFSRYAIRAILAPLWAMAAVWAWWRWVGPAEGEAEDLAHGGERHRYRWALVCGACVAAAFWSHPTGRLLPLVLVGHAVWRTLVDRQQALRVWRGLAAAGGLAVVLSLPLILYFAQHPGQFTGHPSDVSLAAVAAKDFAGNTLLALAHNVGAVAGMFFLAGDPSTFHNLPDLAVFDPFSAVLFVVGLGLLLGALARGPRGPRDQAVLLVLWLGIMLLPTLLSDRPPNYSRAIAALPVIALLPALGLDWLLGRLPEERAAWRWGLAGAALAVAGLWTARHYFVDFAELDHVYYSYDVDKIDAYKALRELAADSNVYLHPLWAEQATIAALNEGGPVRMLDGRQTLVVGADGRDTVLAFPAKEADKEEWLVQAEEAYGAKAQASEGDVRDGRGESVLLTLRVPAAAAGDGEPPTDAPLEPEQWTKAHFGGMIELLGYSIGEARPGQPLPISFTWRVQEPGLNNLTTFVHLLGPDGADWGQEDREPAFASYPTSRWQPGERIIDRFAPVLSEDASGPLTIRVGWYDAATGERLNVGDATEFNLKPVVVEGGE